MRRAIIAALYLPQGLTVDQFFLPPYSKDEIARRGIFQFQIVVGDLILVCFQLACFSNTWLLTVSKSFTACTIFLIRTFWFVSFLR